MINNFKNIDFKIEENEIKAVFKIRLELKAIATSFFSVFVPIFLLSGLAYFTNEKIISIIITSIFFTSIIIIISIFQKQKITIRPFASEAIIKKSSKEQKISWSSEYILDHEINFTSKRKMIDVTLSAYYPNSNKSILIFSFIDLEVFELFQKEYNLNFPLHPIN